MNDVDLVAELKKKRALVRQLERETEALTAALKEKVLALEACEAQLRSLVVTMPDIVYCLDPDGKFTFINDAVSKIGYAPEELVGRHFSTIIQPDMARNVGRKEILKDLKQLRGRKKPVKLFDERRTGNRKTTGLEIILLPRDSREVYYGNLKSLGETSVVAEVSSSGLYRDEQQRRQFIGTIGVIRDISRQKWLERRLQRVNDELEIKVHRRMETLHEQNKALAAEIKRRRQLEQELVQAQKMEAVGTLAGGIAHDFNNILSIIFGYVELSEEHVPPGSELAENLKEIKGAGDRAKALIQQILTFARKSEEGVQPLQIGLIAKEVIKLLRSTIPANIRIVDDVRSTAMVLANPTQAHQIFMNLATNAAQAMAHMDEGVLTISLADETVTAEDITPHCPVSPGPYVVIRVVDTGKGIPRENLSLIFEPYFTTRKMEDGTGLGLAVVHGIVNSFGGCIQVDSRVNGGTCFIIRVPVVKAPANYTKIDRAQALPRGSEHILVVDDETAIVRLTTSILQSLGYRVTSATDSGEALLLFKSDPDKYDLIITDMAMPRLTGERLTEKMLAVRPDVPVLICTGYSARICGRKAEKMGVKGVLMKPLHKQTLARNVRKILDGEFLLP